jgi:hypothetical protein
MDKNNDRAIVAYSFGKTKRIIHSSKRKSGKNNFSWFCGFCTGISDKHEECCTYQKDCAYKLIEILSFSSDSFGF